MSEQQIKAGARVLIKRAMHAAGAPIGSAREWTDEQLWEWARNNPREIAKTLERRFEQAARAWVRGNNSGNPDTLRECEAECELCRNQCEAILSPLGVKVDYPGLYPTFEANGRHYRLDEIRRMLDETCATHRVTRDGLELYRSTEAECFGWLQRHQSASVHHATTHEGYAIERIA